MSTNEDDTKVSPELAAACLANDAAEMIAVAALASCEATRLYMETMRATSNGLPVPGYVNRYQDLLHDILAGREVLSGTLPREGK